MFITCASTAEPGRAFCTSAGLGLVGWHSASRQPLWLWLAGWIALFHPLSPASSPPTSIPAVAVLPFKDLSADKSLEYLGDGVANDIIAMLSRNPDIAVVSRTSSFAYKDKEGDIRQIGKELGVGYLVEGSVRKEGDRVRIVAELIDAKTGDHAWADRFDKAGTDPGHCRMS